MVPPADLFAICNALALAAWIALAASVLVERLQFWTWRVTGLALPALFALVYVGAITAGLSAGGQGGFGSIEAVRALFANDHALTAGWVHYLAFDLVVGTLIARAGAAGGVSPLILLPCLALTFLFGPAGLLLYLAIRLAGGARLQELLP